MNIEIELRYELNETNFAKIADLFKGTKSKLTKDTYYVMENPSHYLRVREEDGRKSLEFHNHVGENTTHEWETEVSDPEIAKEILTHIGKKIDIIVEKERSVKKIDDCLVMWDKVKDLGDFVEIEAESEEKAQMCAEKIGLSGKDLGADKSYPNLVKEKLDKETAI